MRKFYCIYIQISTKFASKGRIDDKYAVVQVLVVHRDGDKPSADPMMTHFYALTSVRLNVFTTFT